MYIPRDPNFLSERAQYDLRHCCEECVFFRPAPGQADPGSEPAEPAEDSRFALDSRICVHGWPNAEHRTAHYDAAPELLVFCKEFEIP